MLCYALLCHAMLSIECPTWSLSLPHIDTARMQDLQFALCMQRKHGMQQELQRLQKDLQDTTAALHLSNDSLQESNSTIDCLRTQMEVIHICLSLAEANGL